FDEQINFNVEGANNTSGTGLTNESGDATFTYTGFEPGADAISACFDERTCDHASKTWLPRGAGADLALTKTADVGSVAPGGRINYTLLVENHGPDAATGVSLSDALPENVTFVSSSASQGSCSNTDCSLGTIGAGGSATVTITVTAQTIGDATDNATVSANEFDPDTGNNSASLTTHIRRPADVAIRGNVTPDAVRVGGELTYHMVVTNNGPDLADDTFVAIAIPAGATFVSVTASQGVCVLTD